LTLPCDERLDGTTDLEQNYVANYYHADAKTTPFTQSITGSGLIDYGRKMTVVAIQMADMKVGA
jgi:hypothetical protein